MYVVFISLRIRLQMIQEQQINSLKMVGLIFFPFPHFKELVSFYKTLILQASICITMVITFESICAFEDLPPLVSPVLSHTSRAGDWASTSHNSHLFDSKLSSLSKEAKLELTLNWWCIYKWQKNIVLHLYSGDTCPRNRKGKSSVYSLILHFMAMPPK